MNARGTALALLIATSGCAVRSVYVKPDFERTDKFTLKRVVVVATPVAGTPAVAARLLARVARRYVLQHKDYIAVRDATIVTAEQWQQHCDKVQGVVRVMVTRLLDQGAALRVAAVADLKRCDSGATVWRVEIRDTRAKQDEDLSKLAGVYKEEFGDAAEKYAAPFFVVVKTAFESMPSPKLTDEETLEKIALD